MDAGLDRTINPRRIPVWMAPRLSIRSTHSPAESLGGAGGREAGALQAGRSQAELGNELNAALASHFWATPWRLSALRR